MKRFVVIAIGLSFSLLGMAQCRIDLDSVSFSGVVERCPEYRVPADFGTGPYAVAHLTIVNMGDSALRLELSDFGLMELHWCRHGHSCSSGDLTGQLHLPHLIPPHESIAIQLSTRMALYPTILNIGGEQVADSGSEVTTVEPTVGLDILFKGEEIHLGN